MPRQAGSCSSCQTLGIAMGTTFRFAESPAGDSSVLAWFRSLDTPPKEVPTERGFTLHFQEAGPVAYDAEGRIESKASPIVSIFVLAFGAEPSGLLEKYISWPLHCERDSRLFTRSATHSQSGSPLMSASTATGATTTRSRTTLKVPSRTSTKKSLHSNPVLAH
jgi:hypothetical protein